jgi:hypothetical protein
MMGSFYRGLMAVRVWNRGVDTGGGGYGRGRGERVGGAGCCVKGVLKENCNHRPSVGFVSTPLPPSSRIKKRQPPATQGKERVGEM